MSQVRAIAMVSNSISATTLRAALDRDGYALKEVALVEQRRMNLDWGSNCAEVVPYDGKVSLRLLGQVKTLRHYIRGSARLKAWLRTGGIQDIYIVNNDNLFSAHVLQFVRRHGRPRLSVVAEGIMNYQEIGLKDRASWRWRVKPLIARALGLSYSIPTTHLSGAFEPEVKRVFSYSATELKAPPEKIVEIPFTPVQPNKIPDPGAALLILNGIQQWMTHESFEVFKTRFGEWIHAQGFTKIYVKQHPVYDAGGMEKVLPPHEIVTDKRNVEQLAPDIPAGTVIGYCTTALVTLKLLRPDLRCIDWGNDHYCVHAYHGDFSVVPVLRSAGIELIACGI
jgi:hypothetical protein